MAVGPLRGGGPPVLPLSSEKSQLESKQPQKLLEKAIDGVLKPGQHLVLPAGTGLANLADHFDARMQPNYDTLLKGETVARAEQSQSPAETHAAQESASSFAAQSAMQMMDLLPLIRIAPPIPTVRTAQTTDVEDLEEPERKHPWQRPSEGDGGADEDFAGPAPALEKQSIELQAGLFTLDEGSVDIRQRRLCTLEAFLDGDVPFVSCAVDLEVIPDGANLRIPALDAAVGRPVRLRAMHQNERTSGVGSAYLEVCVSEASERWRAALERIVAVEIG
jgi:hypothetical protein